MNAVDLRKVHYGTIGGSARGAYRYVAMCGAGSLDFHRMAATRDQDAVTCRACRKYLRHTPPNNYQGNR